MQHLELTFIAASEGCDPEVIVCGILDSEKTVCGNETQDDRIAGIIKAERTRAKVNCPICLAIIRTCKQFKASELA